MDALKYVSQILDDADSWETMMFLYDAALRQMSTKIDILNEEFIHIHNYNPIEHVKSRIKEPKSIVKKLKRHGHEVTLENMLKYITDIAGIRIICSFTQDIYRIADMLAKQSDLRVVELTDYITHPKVSGYRSYHMLVAVPVHLSDRVVDIIVEVQIRTIAQDFWASLEHKIYYKFEGNNTSDKLPIKPAYDYTVFDVIVDLLYRQGGSAKKGNGRNCKLGEAGCEENTVVGTVALHRGRKTGDSVFDPVFVLAAVLEWAGIAENGRGELILTKEYAEKL